MTVSQEDIDRGIQAMESRKWRSAYTHLRPLLEVDDAPPEPLAMLEEASWWLGEIDDSIAAGEKAVARFVELDRPAEAAKAAVAVAERYAHRQQASLARGWIRRAHGLVDGLEPTVALGHLRRMEAVMASGEEGGLEKALEIFDEVQQIGVETGDLDLQMLGLHDRGRHIVYQGDVEAGMGMMEDALVSVVGGELSPVITGRILCNMIEVTSSMADYRSATEWSDQAMRWCEGMEEAGGYPGVCRIKRSEFMRLRGAWDAAESEATQAAADLIDIGPYRAQAFEEIGMIRLALGDLEGAEEAFQQAHSLGLRPMPGLALLASRQGDTAGAWSMIRAALSETDDFLPRAKLIPSAAEIALAADRVEEASVLASELESIAERYDSDLLGIYARQARGRIASHEGRFDEALQPFSEVVSELVSWGLPYEGARARCDLGVALIEQGSEKLGRLEIDEAKREFARLGALFEVREIDQILGEGETKEVNRATKAMMFTDIVDSTKLVGLIGDESWADLIGWHDRTVRKCFENHAGTEVDHAGDGFFVSFDSPVEAVQCAVEIQTVLKEHRKESGFSPRVRIGIHSGEVLESGEGIVGYEVHAAARIAAVAEGGEVLVSDAIAGPTADKFQFGDQRLIDAKGISEPVGVQSVTWVD